MNFSSLVKFRRESVRVQYFVGSHNLEMIFTKTVEVCFTRTEQFLVSCLTTVVVSVGGEICQRYWHVP